MKVKEIILLIMLQKRLNIKINIMEKNGQYQVDQVRVDQLKSHLIGIAI